MDLIQDLQSTLENIFAQLKSGKTFPEDTNSNIRKPVSCDLFEDSGIVLPDTESVREERNETYAKDEASLPKVFTITNSTSADSSESDDESNDRIFLGPETVANGSAALQGCIRFILDALTNAIYDDELARDILRICPTSNALPPAVPAFEAKATPGERLLLLAVAYGNMWATHLALMGGADINARDVSGETGLHWAARTSNPSLVSLLLGRRAEVDAKNSDGETALHWAAYMGSIEIVQALLCRGANANEPNVHGCTALHWAAERGFESLVKVLLESGAIASNVDKYGRTARHRALYVMQKATKNGESEVAQRYKVVALLLKNHASNSEMCM